MTKVPELSIFFPFWNEEANLENVVKKALRFVERISELWRMGLVILRMHMVIHRFIHPTLV